MVQEYLLVDGYNMIFSWADLRELAETNLEAARYHLADMLCNYQGYQKNEIILVFDGHKSKGNLGSVLHYHNIDIVYTKEAETADQFIEMVTQRIAREYRIRVATSDATEQIIILGKGAVRLSARELRLELHKVQKSIEETTKENRRGTRNCLIDNLPADMAELIEKMRLTEDEKKSGI